jgi:hypothetical protein
MNSNCRQRWLPPRIGAVLILLVALSPLTRPAAGQSLAALRFQLDNDYFDFWLPGRERPDNDYTHGIVARAVFNAVPRWARGGHTECGEAPSTPRAQACVQSFISAGQHMFTPINDSPEPVPGERPYGGLLYADFGRLVRSPRQERSLATRVGTTGHASGADATQMWFHRLADQHMPLGWDYQVAGQPVIGLTYGQRDLLTHALLARTSSIALIASGGATATNLQAGVNAGAELRAGYRVPHPWMPATETARRGFRAYLILGSSEEWVARNLLLEGNSRWTTGLVTMRRFVFESVWGLAAGFGDYVLEYRAVSHSREYDTSPEWHRWGTISLIHGTP